MARKLAELFREHLRWVMLWGMTNARSEFEQHLSTIQQYIVLGLSEADTRSHLIDPLLRILGFSDVSHLRREVMIPATKEFLDYELRVDDKPVMIVEAKAARHPLSERDAAQCVQYASVLGVRWCVITNGMTWVFYDAHATGSLKDKWIAEVRLDGEELGVEQAWAVLSAFSRESLVKPNPITSLLVERVVADELTRPDSKAARAAAGCTSAPTIQGYLTSQCALAILGCHRVG